MEKCVISTEDAKKKLSDLRQYIPNAQNETCEFGRLIAERLNPEIVPEGFVLACQLLIHDLQAGVDGRSSLVGMPPIMYTLFGMEIPKIAKAVFPEAFASGVESFIDEIKKKI